MGKVTYGVLLGSLALAKMGIRGFFVMACHRRSHGSWIKRESEVESVP